MRQMLLALGFLGAGILAALAEDAPALTTNAVTVNKQGTLEIPAPKDWKFGQSTQRNAVLYASLHSPSNSIAIEFSIYWDGFGKKNSKPTDADFSRIVSNACVRGFEQTSVEKTIVLENLQGPAVSGTFARFTDSRWVPVLKDNYPNVATGMFRCENLWGTFNLLTYDKDGPQFREGIQVVRSMRRRP